MDHLLGHPVTQHMVLPKSKLTIHTFLQGMRCALYTALLQGCSSISAPLAAGLHTLAAQAPVETDR